MGDPLLDLLNGGAAQNTPTTNGQDPLLQAIGMSAQPVAPVKTQATSTTKPLSTLDKIGQGIMDPINGGAQLLTHMLPSGVVQAGNQLNNWLADKTGLVAKIPAGGVDQMVRDNEHQYQARRSAGGESGFDGYRTVGNLVSPVNVAAIAATPVGGTLAARAGVGALSGVMSGAVAPVADGQDYWNEKNGQIGTGAALGGALAPALGAAARLISPNASMNSGLALLRNEGVNPTIGQALGGAANKVEEKMQSVPIVGAMIGRARTNANSQFQTAAFNRALSPISEELPEGVTGRDAVNYTEGLLKQRYDDVLNKIGAIPADQTFGANIQNLGQMVNRALFSSEAKQKFGTILGDIQSAFGNGTITSEGYKTLESSLGSDFRTLTSSQNIYDTRLAPAVKQMQQELRDLLQRQAGSSADDLQAVNAGWANFKRVQNASSKLGADDGQFTPAQFQNAVRALDKSKDKGAFARGDALGQDLGDAGKSILGSKVPDSGTAGRLLNVGALAALGLNPKLLGGTLAGAGLYLSPVQRALVTAATTRPALAQPTADALRKAGPMLVPGALQFGLQNP